MKLIYLFICTVAFSNSVAQQKVTMLFDYDRAALTATAKATLDSFLKSNSTYLVIQLYGHTDSRGSDEYNDKLSQRRVNTVYDYLVKDGYPKNNILQVIPQGERQPLNANKDEIEMQANRRVEIVFNRTVAVPADTNNLVKTTPTLTEKITDSTTKVGSNIILQNLNFYGGRHVLLPQSEPVLEELLRVLQENPTLEIEIHGHICCAGGAEEGLDIDTNTFELSHNRARVVYEYLVDNGIRASRLSYRGFGHKHPLVYPEDTELKRTTNRRVEIRIVKK